MRESLKQILPKAIGQYLNTVSIVAPSIAATNAFTIFSKPRKGKVSEHHKDFLDSAKDQIIQHNDLSLQTYNWPGKGKTVLLVHGWESHTHRWKILVQELLKSDYNIVAFDAPAHGYSHGERLYVPLYEAALQKVIEHYHPDILIAHSVGGLTAIYNQSINPSTEIKKMVILGPPDKLENILLDFKNILGLHPRVLKALDYYFQRRFNFKTEDFSGSAFAKSLKVPGLLIHDKNDSITPVSGSRAINKNWKNSELIETEGLNHSLYDTGVNQKILAFIAD